MRTRIRPRAALGVMAALGIMAAVVGLKSRQADRQFPPEGKFVTVDGIRLHYVERGTGEPLLLLHGNGATSRELELSGLIDQLADRYRVIAFDRPGYGHSQYFEQSSDPETQATLFSKALRQLGVQSAVVAGHSWGTLVATALALSHPQQVRRLILISGYYFPLPRIDALMMLPSALPWIGGLLRHTVSPLLGRLAWPLMLRKLFSPAPISTRFRDGYPAWLTLRPIQLRTSAREAVRMAEAAARLSPRYGQLAMPVTIITGTGDLQVLPRQHAHRLHDAVPHSDLVLIPNAGHMVHHTATSQVSAAMSLEHETVTVPILAGQSGTDKGQITKEASRQSEGLKPAPPAGVAPPA